MRFKPETLGMLVRPRILASPYLIQTNTSSLVTIRSGLVHGEHYYMDPVLLFGRSMEENLCSLKLGNTANNLTNSYVAQVRSYLVKIGSTQTVVDAHSIDETLKKVRTRYGIRTNLKIISVGVRFFQGSTKEPDGSFRPINPCSIATREGHETTWFYKPWELVPITEIVKYESVNKGDLILFQKCHGLVVKKKFLNKPRFYSTSSWSCYSITLLNHTGDGLTRFLPDRRFTVHFPEVQEETQETEIRVANNQPCLCR